jgi:HEAT repeat protein
MRNVAFLLLISVLMFGGCIDGQSGVNVLNGPAKIDVSKLEGKAVKIIREGLGDQSGQIRAYSVEIAATAGRRELMPKILQLLNDESVAVRFASAIAVGDMDYSAGEYILMPRLEDANPHARMAAAYSLAKLGKSEYAGRIRNLAMNKDQTVRANAAMLLGKLGNKRDLPLLYEIRRAPDSTDKAKLNAIDAIAMVGDEKIYRDKLYPLLMSKYADDRVMGIRGMRALNTVDSRNAIVRMLSDEIPEIRLCAAEQLGRLGDTRGESEVLSYLRSRSGVLNKGDVADVFSTMAIGWIGTDSLRGYLPKLLDSQSRIVQLSAAQSVLVLVKSDR